MTYTEKLQGTVLNKYSHFPDEEFKMLSLLRKRRSKRAPKTQNGLLLPLYNNPIAVSPHKFADLKVLMAYIHQSNIMYYSTLIHL